MASLLESTAVFEEKARDCGLSEASLALLTRQNLDTMGKLAFAPGQPGDTPSNDDLARLLGTTGGDIDLGELASIRRLVFISQTMALNDVKTMVEGGTTEGSKAEMAPAERADRISRQRSRLVGLTLENELECSHYSYDLVMDMMAKNTVLYLPPSRFMSRRAELGREKINKEIVLEGGTTLKVRDRKAELTCDTSSELLLSQALTRRALAFDLVGAASYANMERFNAFLIGHMQSAPPPGYAKVNITQILQADKHAWMRLAEKLTKGIKILADGTKPLDAHLANIESDPKVTFHLLPLPASSPSHADNKRYHNDDNVESNKRRWNNDWRPDNKGKGKGKKGSPNVPPELAGKVTITKTGKKVCWNYNLPSGCSSGVKPGQACNRGLHVCAEPKCGKPHSMQEHK